MSRRKKHEHVNHERWLVSYADFITLLFAFFVVLFASGQSDRHKQQQFATAIRQALSQMALFQSHAPSPALNDNAGAVLNAPPKPIALPLEAEGEGDTPDRQRDDLRARIETVLAEQAKNNPGTGIKPGDMTLRSIPEGLVLSLHEGSFFASGSADIRPQAVETLTDVAALLPMENNIRIEGHTDNIPIRSTRFASNWELSSARASSIARFLLEHSTVNPGHLAVAGYAEFHPVTSNTTEAGRALNRRVDVVFLAGESPGPRVQGPENKSLPPS